MNYFLNRCKNAIARRGKWLLLAIVPPFVYLAASAMSPVFFTIDQKISLLDDGKVNKTVLRRMDAIAGNSGDFFLGDAVIERLAEEGRDGMIFKHVDWSELPSSRLTLVLSALVKESMSLRALDDTSALIAYHGENRKLGEELVAFYSRILRERLEGRLFYLSEQNPFKELLMGGGDKRPTKASGPGKRIGGAEAREYRIPWRSERLGPSLAIFFASLVLLLGAVGLLEWSDPVITSERQAARYMDTEVFGALPDLKEVSGRLHRLPENRPGGMGAA